jgi:hypothetical protein
MTLPGAQGQGQMPRPVIPDQCRIGACVWSNVACPELGTFGAADQQDSFRYAMIALNIG